MPNFDELKAAARRAGQQAGMYAQNASAQLQTGFSLPSECNRAAKILKNFLADPSHPDTIMSSIPKRVLMRAKGLAIFTVVKAGMGWSGKAGSGVVTARLPDGSWSAPTCIVTGGVGLGWQIGADLTEFVIVMNTEEAVRSFGLAGNLTFGGNMSAAAGPIGRGSSGMVSVGHMAPMFSYSRSKGLYAGISLEGTVLMERKDANREFYGQPIPAMDLLLGKVPAPEAASAMYEVIETAEDFDESAFLRAAYPNSSHRTQAGQAPPYEEEPLAEQHEESVPEKEGAKSTTVDDE
ncbi:uncharacterized protein MJAP1_001404 [Malassezia japonica]|uniref:Ysc84 actin-binding domain-containing protein n=1 Tax=Malassezia japonica TaxID=223818 RepID=A0AAF0EWT5_9BASI|nr:uncharacterized protein MJAP1_001404 [Malassezia japonica]WFD38451.1 hypothetical protein MJAP1_001404 [Malassezia japonica]